MINIIKCEMYKLYKTKKIFIMIALVALSLVLSMISELIIKSSFLAGSSGAILPISLLGSSSPFFIPIIIILSLSTILSNEYSNGSLKLILIKPFKRSSILIGKFLSVILITICMLILLIIVGYLFGYVVFGFSDNMIIKGIELSFQSSVKLTIYSYLLSIIPYMAFTSIIIFICILFTQPSTSSVVSLIFLVGSLTIGAIFDNVSPYLVTSYFNVFNFLLEGSFYEPLLGVCLNIFYTIIFLSSSIIIFKNRDFKM